MAAKKTPSQIGRASKAKGKRWERSVATEMRTVYRNPEEVRRGWQSRGGKDEPDVVTPEYSIECKDHKAKVDLRKAWQQAERDAREGTWPIAVSKESGRDTPPLAVMSLECFVDMAKSLEELRRA